MKTIKKVKLKELLTKLNSLNKKPALTNKGETFQIVSSKYFDDLNSRLDKFAQDFDLTPVIETIQGLPVESDNEIAALKAELLEDLQEFKVDLEIELQNSLKGIDVEERLANFKKEILQRVANAGGGSMNRQIRVEGVDVLKRYTDINIYGVTSSVVTSVDNTNKRVNIGIQGGGGSEILLQTNGTANGSQSVLNLKQGTNITVSDDGGGGVTISASAGSVVAGITRVSSVVSVSSTIGATALTDYVVFANVGINLTMPTAISNLNLYTIKNIAASSVLVTTSSGQSIDGSSSALMPTINESLSLISNGSVWGVV